MQKTKAIIFDLGGVILNIDYNLTRKAFENAGIQNFHDMYSQASADELFSNLETGKISNGNFYKEFNKRAGSNLTPGEIKNAWNELLLTFRENSLKFLDSIRPKYNLYLLSNTNHIHLNAFNKIYYQAERSKTFEEHFDKAYYSCAMGLRKPNGNIYEFVLKENNLNPSETLFVDDSVQNVEAARLSGMQAILLEPGKFIEDLNL
ncbi:MAG: HAD family phosphatase [Ginsengibacter sp.]